MSSFSTVSTEFLDTESFYLLPTMVNDSIFVTNLLPRKNPTTNKQKDRPSNHYPFLVLKSKPVRLKINGHSVSSRKQFIRQPV